MVHASMKSLQIKVGEPHQDANDNNQSKDNSQYVPAIDKRSEPPSIQEVDREQLEPPSPGSLEVRIPRPQLEHYNDENGDDSPLQGFKGQVGHVRQEGQDKQLPAAQRDGELSLRVQHVEVEQGNTVRPSTTMSSSARPSTAAATPSLPPSPPSLPPSPAPSADGGDAQEGEDVESTAC